MSSLTTVAPRFVEMSHRIVWCTAASINHRRPDTNPSPSGSGKGRDSRMDRDWRTRSKNPLAHARTLAQYWSPTTTRLRSCDTHGTTRRDRRACGSLANGPKRSGTPRHHPGRGDRAAAAPHVLRIDRPVAGVSGTALSAAVARCRLEPRADSLSLDPPVGGARHGWRRTRRR